MGWIFLLSAVFITCLSLKFENNLYNPVFLLSIFWSLIGFGSLIRLYNMNQTSNKVYLISFLGLVFFALGAITYRKYFKNIKLISYKKYGRILNKKYVFRNKLYIIVCFFMFAYSLHRLQMVLQMIRSGYNLNMIRLAYFGVNVDGYQISKIDSIIETFIHLPALYACMAMISVNLVLPKGKKIIGNKMTIISLVWILIAQFVMGGRMAIYLFGVEVIISYFIIYKITPSKIKRINPQIFKIVLVIIIAIIILYHLSIGRENSGTYDVFKSLYIDFCGCFPHMSLRFEEIDFSSYTWGISLLSGFLRPVMLVYKWIFGDFPDIYNITLQIGSQLQGAVMIGPELEFNAYVLPVFYFYYDCSYLGVIIDSFICGVLCYISYYNVKKSDYDFIYISYYMMIVYGIFTSMIRYDGNLVYYIFSFFVIRLLFKKEKILKNERVVFY